MLRFPQRTLTPGRVFCIGRNYAEHVREMGLPVDAQCVVFMKPSTSLVPAGRPVHLPRGLGAVHHEMEMVVAIGREGREIPSGEALRHLAGYTLGLDLTLRELQARLKASGHPWELSKAFEESAPIGDFVPLAPGSDPGAVSMRCLVDGALRQEGSTAEMLFPVERLVEILSRTWRLLPGDLIFTGTPPGVGPVEPGQSITLESPQVGTFTWELV